MTLGEVRARKATSLAAPRTDAGVLAAAQRRSRSDRRRRQLTAGVAAVAVTGLAVAGLATLDGDHGTSVETDPGPVASDPPPTTSDRSTSSTTTNAAAVPSVAVAAAGHDLLIFGSDGITRVVGGVEEPLWSEPVVSAFDDGSGGVVFQEAGPDGAIRWEHGVEGVGLVGPGLQTVLHGVVELEGATTVLYTRSTGGRDTGQPEREEHLFSRPLVSGGERELGVTGGIESGLDAVGLSSRGLLVSTCHLQCGVRGLGEEGQEEVVVPADWIGGLDVSEDVIAYVRATYIPEEVEGTFTSPMLVLADLDGTVRAEVALPAEIQGRIHVDLSEDGRSALIWAVPYETGVIASTILVEDLGAAEQTVRRLATSQAARFAGPPAG